MYQNVLLWLLFVLGNFKKAWHKQVEIESSATETELEAPQMKKKRPTSSSTDESDTEGILLSNILIGRYYLIMSNINV